MTELPATRASFWCSLPPTPLVAVLLELCARTEGSPALLLQVAARSLWLEGWEQHCLGLPFLFVFAPFR